MTPDKITRYGDELYEALVARRTVAPLLEREPDITIEDAYQIQLRMIERRVQAGETIVGKKIGVTAKAVKISMVMVRMVPSSPGTMLSRDDAAGL